MDNQATELRKTLENEIGRTIELSIKLDLIAFGERPQAVDKPTGVLGGEIDRLIDRLEVANSKISSALHQLENLK